MLQSKIKFEALQMEEKKNVKPNHMDKPTDAITLFS